MRNQKTQCSIQTTVFALLLVVSSYGQSNKGSICLAPVDLPNNEEKNLGNPSGENRVQSYEVQIDSKPKIKVSNVESTAVNGLAVNKKHSVKILGDGKAIQSFRFDFKEYSGNKLCLHFKSLYETWLLNTTKDAGKTCQCK